MVVVVEVEGGMRMWLGKLFGKLWGWIGASEFFFFFSSLLSLSLSYFFFSFVHCFRSTRFDSIRKLIHSTPLPLYSTHRYSSRDVYSDSDDSGNDMEANYEEEAREERRSAAIAKREDEEALKEENRKRREKEERRKRG